MKKLLLSAICLVLAVGMNAQDLRFKAVKNAAFPKDVAKEATATTLDIGYCGEMKMSWAYPNANTTMALAIKYPAAEMKKYVGNQLTKIKVAIGTDTGIKNSKVFLAYNLTDEPFYIQDATFKNQDWTEITLDTPYDIEEKDIYIGYMLTSGSNKELSQFSTDQEAGSPDNYIAIAGNGGKLTWYTLSAMTSNSFNLGIKAVLEGNSLPQYDFGFNYLMPEKGLLANDEKATVKGLIKIQGAQNVQSFDLVYQVGDAAPVTLPVKDQNLKCLDRYNFTIKDLAVAQGKSTGIKVTIDNVNGLGSEVPATGPVVTSVLNPGSESVARKVLLENFTTAECPNCPTGHKTLESVVGDNPNIIWISPHSAYYTDDYTTQEALDLTWFFNYGGRTYAPAMMLDRTDMSSQGAKPEGGNSAVFGISKAIAQKTLDYQLEAPAYATVNLEKNYDPATRKFTLTVKGKALYGNLPGDTRLNVYLIEDGLVGPQSGGGNKYVHNHVLRGSLTGTWGEPVTFDAEGNYTASYEVKQFGTAFKPENMKAVVFLSNYDPWDAVNCPVYNAEAIGIYPEAGIDTSVADASTRIYSGNSQITIDGEFTSAMIFDTTGKIVESLGAQNTSSKMASGIYIVKIVNNDQTIVKRIAVK